MINMIFTLLIAGFMAGLIQFFIDFKGLPLYIPVETYVSDGDEKSNNWTLFYNWIKSHWQFFGYITIGIAGAFLTPLINEVLNGNLNGLVKFKEYAECIATPRTEKPICVEPDNWYYLILFGYGIVFGYSSVRIIRSIGSLILGRLQQKQNEQQRQLDENIKEIKDLKNKLVLLSEHIK